MSPSLTLYYIVKRYWSDIFANMDEFGTWWPRTCTVGLCGRMNELENYVVYLEQKRTSMSDGALRDEAVPLSQNSGLYGVKLMLRLSHALRRHLQSTLLLHHCWWGSGAE
jgi:hypothetical protein